jgi:hypothetical protein
MMVSVMKSVVAVMIVLAWFMASLSCEVADDLVIFPQAEDITCNSTVISWESGESDRGRLEYGETKDYGLTARESEDPTRDYEYEQPNEYDYHHHVHLEGLRPETTYYYKVTTLGWLRDGSFITLPTPKFGLLGYKVIDEDYRAALQIQFTANCPVKVRLLDPGGREVDSASPEEGVTEVVLLMETSDNPLDPGRYTLIVSYGDTQIAAPTIDFAGFKLTVSQVSPTWSASGGGYDLTAISIKVKNTGDLPADIQDVDVSVRDKSGSLSFGWEGVWPGVETTITAPVRGVQGVSPGQTKLNLVFKDSSGQVVDTCSETVAPA